MLFLRSHSVSIQIDIKGEKLWIQSDGTEVGVANELIEEGIPKDDIVLAFCSGVTIDYESRCPVRILAKRLDGMNRLRNINLVFKNLSML